MLRRSALIAATALSFLTAPAASAQQISASDRRLGAQEHPKILQQFGGVYRGPGVAMVDRVGKAMAVQSGLARTGSECTVTLLNSPVVNAFAVPGCYVYVTRGLLAIMDDEAELASVLGHEIGHVSARHSQKRQRGATAAGLGSVLASIFLGSTAGQLANLLGQGAVQGYSRNQEYEADELGVRYSTGAGYDPYAAADMLESLSKDEALQAKLRGADAAAQVPAFARSHPLTRDRVTRSTERARATGISAGARPRNQQQYLTAIDGMLYGDDPSQGFVEDQTFSHPGLKLRFTAPKGFYLQNEAAAVTMVRTDGVKAQFSGGRLGAGGLREYAGQVAQQLIGNAQGVQAGREGETRINGLDAYVLPLRVPTQRGSTDVTVTAYRFGSEAAYSFVTLAPAGQSSVFDGLVGSLRELSDAEAAALKPRVIDVVTVKPGDTLQSVASRMAFRTNQLDRFLALNDREANQPLRPGEQVKIVTQAR